MDDLRLAVRGLRSSPVVSAVAILSLALGIGANTAIFSLVDRLILRALPVAEPDRLVMLVDSGRPQGAGFAESWPNPVWEEVRDRLDSFGGGFAWEDTFFNLAAGGEARMVSGLRASGAFFETLGIPAHLGRTFTTADDARGGGPDGPVAVLSYDYWQREFESSPQAIGRTVAIGAVPFTVVGVTPPRFTGPSVGRAFDIAVPLGTEALVAGPGSALDIRGRFWLGIMLRLKPDQSIESATAMLRAMQPQIRDATLPDLPAETLGSYLSGPFAIVPASHGWSPLRARFEQPLLIIMGVVALVLLVACANVANLLLARAAARRHELSVRSALGAPRARLVRQLFVESLVLAGIGAALGLAFAQWTGRLLLTQLSFDLNQVYLDLSLDWRILGFTTVLAVATALLFGTAPAWRATRLDAREALNDQGRGTSLGARSPIASALVVTQVALSLVLVVAAGLFTRTFAALATRDLGFSTDRTLIVSVTTPMTRFKPEELTGLYQRLLEAVEAVPGVDRAAISDVTPTSGAVRNVPILVPGIELPAGERLSFVNVVSPNWFATYGGRLLAGRDFGRQDQAGTTRVGIVNEAFARKFLNGENPVGRTIRDGFGAGTPIEIVGYASDAVYRSLRDPAPPTLYTAFAQRPVARPFVSITVRTSTDAPAALTRSLMQAIGGVNPELDLRSRLLADQVGATLAQERVVAVLAAFFGALALLLAGLGLYGVTAHSVSRRRGELGIRIALGAASAGIVALVLRRVAALVLVGIAAGALLSWWATRFVSAALLYGVEPRDPTTLALAGIILALVGILAGWVPARRAASLNPVVALRAE